MESDDQSLALAAASGDGAAFAALLSRHYDRLFALAGLWETWAKEGHLVLQILATM